MMGRRDWQLKLHPSSAARLPLLLLLHQLMLLSPVAAND
jgi:hypothetical protein